MRKPSSVKELKYYGIHACLAIGEYRPGDIIRVYIDASNVKTFRPILKWCADNKKAYHIVTVEELDKVSASVHHEGICILARESGPISAEDFFKTLSKTENSQCLLYLDGVQNPHNIGSILRTCAHFGVTYLLGEKGKLPALSPSACRIAKGGAEMVRLVEIEKPKVFFSQLIKRGFSLVSTSSHVSDSLYNCILPKKMILAMGSEADGVSKEVLSLSSKRIQIPGSGLVESLNVSVATSLCLGEYFRQHGGFSC
jgi:TrmH RNA methyltransferase